MTLRFSSLAAVQAAIGKHAKVRDPFRENETKRGGQSRSRRRHGPTPHDILWDAVSARLEGAVREFKGAIPDRKHRIDIAIPAVRLAIEVDGWEWHGKHKGDFTRDRVRQNLLTQHGWRILRFTAGQIRKDVAECVDMIERSIEENQE